jgi:cold shock protein
MNGVIKKKTEKGFGFIAIEGADDIFFHSNSLVDITFDEIKEGDSVTFEIEETQKGKNAKDVRKA